jgi:hypothetical protein
MQLIKLFIIKSSHSNPVTNTFPVKNNAAKEKCDESFGESQHRMISKKIFM